VTLALGAQPIGRDGRVAEPTPFAAPRWDPQALFSPQALHALAIDRPAELTQTRVRAPVAPARPLSGDLTQLGPQRPIDIVDGGVVALGGAVLPDEMAGPALADAEAFLQQQDRSAPAGWAQKFPFANSFSACACSA
jgi:hypothetical protein